MKLPVYNQQAESIGEVELNSKIFDVKPSLHLLAEAVRISQANSRQGSGNTKTRGEVSGGGKKPWKQKGTGRARAGSNRSPIWRHGGVTFGPRSNRNWTLKMNKRAKSKALFMSLSDKAKNGGLVIIKEVKLEAPKTKEMAKVFQGFTEKLKLTGKNQLFLLPKKDESIFRSTRNLESLKPLLANNINVVEIMKADTIYALEDSLKVIEKTFLKPVTSGK